MTTKRTIEKKTIAELMEIGRRVTELPQHTIELVSDLYKKVLLRRTDKYRMGIVVALPKELAAVQAMMDEVYEEASDLDEVCYVVGVIRSAAEPEVQHRVVIAATINMGNNAASIATTSMLKDFPLLKDVLMVGIAGGIPHKDKDKDVFLGDVVVSSGRGLVQYDMTKIEDEKIIPRGIPLPPSHALLTSVAKLEADRIAGKSVWENYIARGTHLEASARPEKKTDPRHREKEKKNRDGEHPKVHFGIIGSANLLVKKKKLRDELKREHNVIAVEMEGSGVADATWSSKAGYLIVRGICDYCDKEKNDIWQGYAAVAAAAYARAIIERVPFPRTSRI